MHLLKNLKNYILERFTLFPWAIIPFYFLMLFGELHTPIVGQYFVLWAGLLFFRCFDDYYCRGYDSNKQKERRYLVNISGKEHRNMVIVLFVIFTLLSFFIWEAEIFRNYLFLVLISLILYLFLAKYKIGQYISLLKYPFFIYTLTDTPDQAVLLVFVMSFLLFEMMEFQTTKFKHYIVFIFPIFIRLLGAMA